MNLVTRVRYSRKNSVHLNKHSLKQDMLKRSEPESEKVGKVPVYLIGNCIFYSKTDTVPNKITLATLIGEMTVLLKGLSHQFETA
jgi:hypothetical protein